MALSNARTRAASDDRIGRLCVLAAALLWSFGGLGIKRVVAQPVAIAGLRAAFALPVLAGAAWLTARGRPGAIGAAWRRPCVWGAALCYAVTVVTFVVATKLTTAANAIFLQYTGPIYVALLSWPVLKERIGKFDALAIGGCLVGMALLLGDRLAPGARLGDALAVISGISFGGLPLFLRLDQKALADGDPAGSALSPLLATLLGSAMAAIACAPQVPSGGPRTLSSWAILAALGLLQIGLAYVLYSAGVRRLRAIESSLWCEAEPLLNPVWVALGTGEKPAMGTMLGGAVILLSLGLQAIGPAALQRKAERCSIEP